MMACARLGLAWSGLAELRLTSFAVPPDEAVFFRGRVVQVLEREENAFDALADAPRNGYSFVMQKTLWRTANPKLGSEYGAANRLKLRP